jgi:hypothetical protein
MKTKNMSTQQVPLTYESVLGLIEKVTLQMQAMTAETDRKIEKTTAQMQAMTAETDRKIPDCFAL